LSLVRFVLILVLSVLVRFVLIPVLSSTLRKWERGSFEKKFGSAAERSLNEVCSWLKGGS